MPTASECRSVQSVCFKSANVSAQNSIYPLWQSDYSSLCLCSTNKWLSNANILSMAKSYYDSARTFILQLCKSMPFISEIRIICFDIRAFHEVAVERVERNGADIVAELIKKNIPKCLCIANKWEMCNIVVVVFLSILLSSFGQQNSTQALDDVLPKCTHT